MTKPIVCATRGGEASRSTQEHAIALAKERGAELVFLYVADCAFAGPLNGPLSEALKDELMRLGRALLYIAQARAREHGVKSKVLVFCGTVRETLWDYLHREKVSTFILGASGAASGSRTFNPEEVRQFAESVAHGTGVEVMVVTADGQII
jgi:nucleotide-binding universal stress UspA family protein